MIDIKAIREAAETAQKFFFNRRRVNEFHMLADPVVVIALCDEVERLTAANSNLFDLGQKMFKELEGLQHKVFHLENVIKAMEAN